MNNTARNSYTRQQYLNGECSHEQYYNQFITPYLLDHVKRSIGIAAIKKALTINENLNSIPLERWDGLAISAKNSTTQEAMRKAGDYPTLAGYVCLLKAAARQLVSVD